MPISSDTTIDFTNKIISVTGTTVYDVSVLYSYSKEQFKLSANIDDDFAWTANTPTNFTLKNGWYLRTDSIRRLKNGSITANYGTNEIEKITLQTAGYTNVIESDIGKTVTDDAVGIGELVDFDNTRKVWWVRTNGTVTSVAAASTMAITTGTGAGTSDASNASVDDTQDLWTNINTIGDLSSTGQQPLMYVYTSDLTTGDFGGNARRNEGWNDDPDPTLLNSDRGALDVLIRIKDSGITLGNPVGEIRVYGRQGLFKFADFAIDISAGGRISVPIAQSNDTEDTIGEVWLAIDGRNTTDPIAGEEMTWGTADSAEVVSFIEGANSTNGVVQLRGLTSYPTNDTAVTFSGGGTGTTRGTVGGQLITIDAETSQADEVDYGNILTGGTSGAKAYLVGHLTLTETGTGQAYLICESNHDLKADSTYYTDFSDNDNITGTGVDVTADFVTTSYSRLAFDLDDIQIKLAAFDLTVGSSTSFAIGDNITQQTSGAKGTILEIPDGTSIIVSLNNTTAFDPTNSIDDDDSADTTTVSASTRVSTLQYTLPLQSAKSYYGLINCNNRTATEVFHYIKYFQQARATAGNTDPNSRNSDPDQDRELNMMKQELGAGTLILQAIQGEEFFRAFTDEDTPANNPTDQSADSRIAVKPGAAITTGQGWALINIASGDANNYTLTATDGSKNAPFASISVSLTNLISGDHVEVVLDDGTGQEDKSQFTLGAGNTAGNTSIIFNASLPNDTPTGSGDNIVVKLVDITSTSPENKELRYRGTSYTGTTVTLATGDTGTATSAGTSIQLNDTGIHLGTLEVGDVIRNTTDGSYAWIKEIDTDLVITTTLEGGTDNTWEAGDTWDSNVLAISYASGSDTGYIPYIDRVANATSESEVLTFVSNRNVVIRVRNTSIVDFDTTGTITSAGISVGAVRQADSIYSPT